MVSHDDCLRPQQDFFLLSISIHRDYARNSSFPALQKMIVETPCLAMSSSWHHCCKKVINLMPPLVVY